MAVGRTLARSMGVVSLGLGLAQVVVPRRVARLAGFPDKGASPLIVRAVGVRELVSAGGLLVARWPAGFQWLRVAGDAMDLALMGAVAGRMRRAGPLAAVARAAGAGSGTVGRRTGAALGAVAAITAADVVSGVLVSRAAPAQEDGATTASGRKPVRRSITIAKPRDQVYGEWRDLAGLPRFTEHLLEVTTDGDGGRRSHWKAKAPVVGAVEWDAELTEDVPGERIAWRAVEGSPVTHEGAVVFRDAPGDRGTEVTVDFAYAPPAGPVGVAVAKVLGEEPEQQVADDLRRFKQLLETGEVVTSASRPQSDA